MTDTDKETKSDPVEVMAEAIEQSMREISVGEDADGMSYGLLDAIADARGEPDLSGAGDVLRDAALDVARSALAAAESAGMVMVPKNDFERICLWFDAPKSIAETEHVRQLAAAMIEAASLAQQEKP